MTELNLSPMNCVPRRLRFDRDGEGARWQDGNAFHHPLTWVRPSDHCFILGLWSTMPSMASSIGTQTYAAVENIFESRGLSPRKIYFCSPLMNVCFCLATIPRSSNITFQKDVTTMSHSQLLKIYTSDWLDIQKNTEQQHSLHTFVSLHIFFHDKVLQNVKIFSYRKITHSFINVQLLSPSSNTTTKRKTRHFAFWVLGIIS